MHQKLSQDHLEDRVGESMRAEPDCCGFLRGRVVRLDGHQLIVVYCRSEALAEAGAQVEQFVRGLEQIPIPIDDEALVVSDNADIYGTCRTWH
jgi:hypothetical protein